MLSTRISLFFLGFFVFLAGCMETYSSDLQGEDENIYVVSSEVTNHVGFPGY